MSKPKLIKTKSVLRLHMEGLKEHQGEVRLNVFIGKLKALREALGEIALSIDGSSVDFFVSHLSHSSPAMVELTAFSANEKDAKKIVDDFLGILKNAGRNEPSRRAENVRIIEKIAHIMIDYGEIEGLWIDGPGIPLIHLDKTVSAALQASIPRIRKEYGLVKGVVKKYSGTGDRPIFKIIPPGTNEQIKCIFGDELLEEARKSLEKSVSVEGVMHSYAGSFWPHQIYVKTMSVGRPPNNLARLTELRGAAKSASDEASSVDFVRELRNEW